MHIFTKLIAQELHLPELAVDNTIALLEQGCTIPFIARYRKERTGALDEVAIADINEAYARCSELMKRKATVVKAIEDQQKMTDELRRRIDECRDAALLEDIYLPFRPKRRSRAETARRLGLEPLADLLWMQREPHPEKAAARFVGGEVENVGQALAGAQDIIAERISEDEQVRNSLRNLFSRSAVITSKAVKSRADSDEAAKYSDYFGHSEPLKRCSSHRLLAIRRGENEGFLRVSIDVDEDFFVGKLCRRFAPRPSACGRLVEEAVADAYKRLLKPSMENEFAALSKQKADHEAILVFAENLLQLLLAPPLGQKRVMAIDPGFRTGCKVVCLDSHGGLLHHETIFPHPPVNRLMQAKVHLHRLLKDYRIEAVAVGNGTAGRETQRFVRECVDEMKREEGVDAASIGIYMVSEDGASIYSASKTAREEFPELDLTVRGAVSIGRRLMDPLAELVKIDPKSIGVGQYQHDVDAAKLKRSLDTIVERCVNTVGVNLNTAGVHLLTYVSGLGPVLAANIVNHRSAHGRFASRRQLLDVPKLGKATFEQCAGFLRIDDAENPLDNSAVHPESYHVVEAMARDARCTVRDLIGHPDRLKHIDLERYVSGEVGLPTLRDIIAELEKPGRDPRRQVEAFEFAADIHDIGDVQEGMVLPGIVTNITNFGAFVDIGVHQDGLVHVSRLADRFVKDPGEVVKLHQHVWVKVIEVDLRRKRISLSMRGVGVPS